MPGTPAQGILSPAMTVGSTYMKIWPLVQDEMPIVDLLTCWINPHYLSPRQGPTRVSVELRCRTRVWGTGIGGDHVLNKSALYSARLLYFIS